MDFRHVGWWNLITSVCLTQVGKDRNDHFRYFLGVCVRLIVGVRLIQCPLNTGFIVVPSLQISCFRKTKAKKQYD